MYKTVVNTGIKNVTACGVIDVACILCIFLIDQTVQGLFISAGYSEPGPIPSVTGSQKRSLELALLPRPVLMQAQ
jgi:hypothetical protein